MRTTKVFWIAVVACLGIPLLFFFLLLNRELLSDLWGVLVQVDHEDHVVFESPEYEPYSRDQVTRILGVLRTGAPEDRERSLGRLTAINRREHPWLKESILGCLQEDLAAESRDPASLVEGAMWVLGPEALPEFRQLTLTAHEERWPGLSWCVWLLHRLGDGSDLELLGRIAGTSPVDPAALAAMQAMDDLHGVPVRVGSWSWVQNRVWILRQWTRSRPQIDRKIEARVELFHGCPPEDMHRVMDCVLRSTDLPVEDYPGPSEFTDGVPFEFPVEGGADSGRSIFRLMLIRKQWGPILAALQRDLDPRHQEVLWTELSQGAPPGRNWPLQSFHAVACSTLTRDDDVPERTRLLAAEWIARTTFGLERPPAIDLVAFADLDWGRWTAEDPERACRIRRFLTRMLPADVSRVIHPPHDPRNPECSAWTSERIQAFQELLRSGALRFDPDQERYVHSEK